MRSRAVREGSVGLFILVGLGVFIGLVLWLRGVSLGNRKYQFTVSFADAIGMKEGAVVRYRGVTVGKIVAVNAKTNGVDTIVQISESNLLIPKNVSIDANQTGFVGETSIDITPRSTQVSLPSNTPASKPQGNQCNSEQFICAGDRVKGQVGVSFIEVLASGTELATLYSKPEFYNNITTLTKSAATAATDLSKLSKELALLSRSTRGELRTFSTAATSVTSAANQTASQVSLAANRISTTTERLGNTAQTSASQLNQLATNANALLVTNRTGITKTLDSISQTSDRLGDLLASLTPAVAQINSATGKLNTAAGQFNVGGLLKNLETLSANAAAASANLRDVSTALNNPENILVLQKTLDSARATFENAQKITSDLDDLTGDPAFRNNLKQLVNGLGNLVSTTEQLQQQVRVAQKIEPISASIDTTASNAEATILANQQLLLNNIEPTTTSSPSNLQTVNPSEHPSVEREEPVISSTQPNPQKQFSKLLPPAPKKP
ncbi:MAG TPA: MlaD family protein [Allocoleopsis sp.]